MRQPRAAGTTLVYVTPMTYPNPKAHSVQITRTVTALAQLVPVILVVKEFSTDPAQIRNRIREVYDCEVPEQLQIIQLPRWWFKPFAFPLLLWSLRRRVKTENWVFYTRAYKLARRLIFYRSLHGKRVYFETHLKDAVCMKDPVPNSPYSAIRKRWENENEGNGLAESVYRNSDYVFFLHRHSEERARTLFGLCNTASMWYGLKQQDYPESTARRGNFVYCGSVSSDRLFELLMDAAGMAGDWFMVDVIGGSAEDIAQRKAELGQRNLAHHFDFKGYVPSAELPLHLQRYRFGISLIEGMKVADYVENGVIPVIPRSPSLTDVFDDSNAVFFEPDSAASLCEVLKASLSAEYDDESLMTLVNKHSTAQRAETIARYL